MVVQVFNFSRDSFVVGDCFDLKLDAIERMNSKSYPLAQKLKAIAIKFSSILLFYLRIFTSSVLIHGGSYLITSSMIYPPNLSFFKEKALLQR
jgi:hypothetical protein